MQQLRRFAFIKTLIEKREEENEEAHRKQETKMNNLKEIGIKL
jgi:hypothetical protein